MNLGLQVRTLTVMNEEQEEIIQKLMKKIKLLNDEQKKRRIIQLRIRMSFISFINMITVFH